MAIVYSLVYHCLWSGRLGVVVERGVRVCAGSVVGARGVRVVTGWGEVGLWTDQWPVIGSLLRMLSATSSSCQCHTVHVYVGAVCGHMHMDSVTIDTTLNIHTSIHRPLIRWANRRVWANTHTRMIGRSIDI